VEGHDQNQIFFLAFCAGSVPPFLLWTGAPHFQVRSGSTAYVNKSFAVFFLTMMAMKRGFAVSAASHKKA